MTRRPLPPDRVTLPAAVVDPFAEPTSDIGPVQARPILMAERTEWLRDTVELHVPASVRDPEVAVEVILTALDAPADDVRVILWGADAELLAFRVPRIPAGGSVRVRSVDKRVWTSGPEGAERLNNGFARAPDGGPMTWPDRILSLRAYWLTVDRAPHSAPVNVQVAIAGRRP